MCYYLNVHFLGQRVKNITVFWDMKLCHLVDMYRYFLFYPDDVQHVSWNADIYRVIQEEMLIFWKLIVLAIMRKKFHIIMISNSEWLLRTSCLNLCAVQNAQHTTHTLLCDMLPHHQITHNDVILPNVLT